LRTTGQRIFVVQRDDYLYLVPFVEDDKLIALKTWRRNRTIMKLDANEKEILDSVERGEWRSAFAPKRAKSR
jgi:hypothetical protein